MGTVFRKTLKLSPKVSGESSVGNLVSIMTTDSIYVGAIFPIINHIIDLIIQLFLYIGLLYYFIQYTAFV
jgi:hypothetical protein